MAKIELGILPENTIVHWNNMDTEAELRTYNDEDMVWISLPNGISIDAGQYGHPSFFKVSVVGPSEIEWYPFEESICKTVQEVSNEITRLANKYTDKWFADLCLHYTKENDKYVRKQIEDFECLKKEVQEAVEKIEKLLKTFKNLRKT